MKTVIQDLSWWRKRTTFERCQTLILIFACILVIGLVSIWISVLIRNEISEEVKSVLQPSSSPLVIWLTENPADKDIKQEDVCGSMECLNTASDVLDKMNPAIEPCDDFYQFACGKFIENSKIPADRTNVDIVTKLSDKLEKQIETIITEERLTSEPTYLTLPHKFYKACMNTTLIESRGTQMIEIISDYLGGWPVIVGYSWDSYNSWSWQDTMKKLRRLGFSRGNLLRISVGTDWKNSTKYIIKVDQPILRVGGGNLFKAAQSVGSYNFYDYMLDYMVDIAVMFGALRTTARRELNQALQFQNDLSYISQTINQTQNLNNLYNLRSIKELQKSYPYIQWLDLINAFLPQGQEVDENEVVNLMTPRFFDQLGIVLARTKTRTIANYMIWSVYDSAMSFLTKELRERQFKYDAIFSGQVLEMPRWKQCINIVTSNLDILVGSLFVRKQFNEDSKNIALETVNNIRDALDQMLDDAKWIDDNTKQQAKKKLRDMQTFIGYPDETLDNDELEKYYRDLVIDSEKYFESYFNIKAFQMDKMFQKLRMPADKPNRIENFKPADINAFYSLVRNSIQFPAGILQNPFFSHDLPNYMNYGAIGSVIGHEISHGFSGGGRRFDANGQLKDWWQPDTDKEYVKKARCIIGQYNKYKDKQTGLNLKGRLSQEENIADIAGIQLSYFAYDKWVAEHGEEEKLLGLNYTPRQMFWVSFAQIWCAKYTTETLEQIVKYSQHVPGEFRVLGSLRNIKEFSRDFQCHNNTLMNPVDKCVIW